MSGQLLLKVVLAAEDYAITGTEQRVTGILVLGEERNKRSQLQREITAAEPPDFWIRVLW